MNTAFYEGKLYEAIEHNVVLTTGQSACLGCAFHGSGKCATIPPHVITSHLQCVGEYRTDGRDIIWIEKESPK